MSKYLISDPMRIQRMQTFIKEGEYKANDFPDSYPKNEGGRIRVPGSCQIVKDCMTTMLNGTQQKREYREELVHLVKFLDRHGKFEWFINTEPRFAAGGYAAHVLIR